MLGPVRRFIRNQQFHPGWAGAFVNPFFLARRALRRAIQRASANLEGALLDVGCGSMPYRALFATDTYIGLEIDSPQARARQMADFFYDGGRFPFENDRFGAVLCNQVLEHVFEPGAFLDEIGRVLAPGGKLLLTVPFVWDEHEQPHDFARYSSFGLKYLLEQRGFVIIEQHKLLADISVIFQLLNAYIFKVTLSRFTVLNLLITALVLGPLSLLGWALGTLLPHNEDLFLDQLVVAAKPR